MSVEAQDGDPGSTLTLYRDALRLRRELRTDEALEWVETGAEDVLAFRRSSGWLCLTNTGSRPAPFPDGEVLLASGPVDGIVSGGTTAWVRTAEG